MGVSNKLEWDILRQAVTSRLPIGNGGGEIPAIKFDKTDGFGLRVDVAGAPAFTGVANPNLGPGPEIMSLYKYGRDFVGGDSLTQSVEAFFRYEFGAGALDQAVDVGFGLRSNFVPGDVSGYDVTVTYRQIATVKSVDIRVARTVANVGVVLIPITVFPGAAPTDSLGVRMSVRDSGTADVDYKIDLSVDGGQNWSNYADAIDLNSPLFGVPRKFNFAVLTGGGHNYEAGQFMDLDQIRFLNTYDAF